MVVLVEDAEYALKFDVHDGSLHVKHGTMIYKPSKGTSNSKSDDPVFDPSTSLRLEVGNQNVFTAQHFKEFVSMVLRDDLTSLTLTIFHVIVDEMELTTEMSE